MRKPKDYDRLPDDARLTSEEVASLVGKSKPTVFRWVATGLLPPTRSVPIGARPTHRLGDVRALLRPPASSGSKPGGKRQRATAAGAA